MYFIIGFFVALYGALFSSFFTLVGYRVPLKQSIVNPPSHCSNCKKRLGFLDLIPILSYLFNRGKCRNCKVGYGSFHFWIELSITLLFLATYLIVDLSWSLLFICSTWLCLSVFIVALKVHKKCLHWWFIIGFIFLIIGIVFYFY